jgi:asparagine synthase (glutamine-hydrolysing)
MCGILAIFRSVLPEAELKKKLIECSMRLRHRGPDWSGYIVEHGNGIAHERLAIIDPESGTQPLVSPDGNVVVAANGEIYNYKELYSSLKTPYSPLTGSDCEVVIPLYEQLGAEFPNLLRGMFSFIIYDRRDKSFLVVRDHVGITPLYMGYGADGSTWIASEMKALAADCAQFDQFLPGHIYNSKTGTLTRWYNPDWMEPIIPRNPYNKVALRDAFICAVKRRMMSDVPWGVLLSGGLDSSLVASVASRIITRAKPEDGITNWFPKLHSFCVGLQNSPDLIAAKKVADFLGTIHHSYTYTIQEGLNAIREVIYHVETFDTTTIRASTAMFLMSRKIKAMGIKMVLSGEGSDEVFAGYLYFHKAPNAEELQAELRDKIKNLYLFDCLRANKSTSAWGLEARVPFLDRDFLDVAMNIDPEEKMIKKDKGRIEKYILRDAFDTPEDPYLPHEILWRQKEQFSDGVGYGWIDSLRALAESSVTDQQFKYAANRFPENTPLTKEAYLYRSIFEEHFPQPSAARTVPGGPSIACSTARAISWDESFKNRADCSGRSVAGVHLDAYSTDFVIPAEAPTNGHVLANGVVGVEPVAKKLKQ